jgi:flavin-dependent dehydrogenase
MSDLTDLNCTPTPDYGRNTNRADVLIIGAGISGMTTAIDMIRKEMVVTSSSLNVAIKLAGHGTTNATLDAAVYVLD